MADKDYNVKLQVQLGDSVSNIDQLLQKVTTLKSAVADLGEKEMALNVVVRNTGFQNAIANINKSLMSIADTSTKAGTEIGNKITDGVDKSADKLKKSNSYKAVAKEIAESMKAEIEGTLKGLTGSLEEVGKKVRETLEKSFNGFSGESLTNLVADAVTSGMVKATKRYSTVGMNAYNAQTDAFKGVIDQFKDNNSELNSLAEEITDYFTKLKEMLGSFTKSAVDVLKTVAKEKARAEVETKWSEDHMSLKDKRHADVEDRRAETEQYRAETERQMAELAKFTQQLANEREMQRSINDEVREETRLRKELEREERKAQADIMKSKAQEVVALKEAEKLERDAAAEEERKARVKARSAKQFALISEAAQKEANREKLYETELEKALYDYQVAENRILSQKQSSLDGARVSESAIANAAKQKRDAEIRAGQALAKQLLHYDDIQQKMELSVESTRKLATNLQRASSAISSVGGIFSTIRSVSTSLAGMIKSAGSTFLGYARQAANTLKDSALDQYQSLQTAEIGFKNFFGTNAAKDLIKQIREQAMKAPGVDAGQLADYVKQVAPVSNHNSQLALDAAMGMIKTIQYGGADASEEMEYVIKNVRDVIAKGTATAIDLRQFNRAMPILEEVLGSIGASDFIKNGTLKIDKNNAKDLLAAFAKINNDPDSPVANIFEQMEHTLSGITDIIKQTFVTKFNETLEGLGFYDKLQKLLERFYKSGAIEKFYNFLATAANRILDFVEGLDWDNITQSFADGFKAIWQAIKDVVNMFAATANGANIGSIIQKFLNMIASFLRGFGEGINKILQFVSWADQKLGSDTLNRLANLLGTIASPLGKLIQSGLGLAQNLSNLGSRLLYMKAENTRAKMDTTLARIAEEAMVAGNNNLYQAAAKSPTIAKLASTKGTITRGSIEDGNLVMYNKNLGTLTRLNDNGSYSTYTELNNRTRKELNSLLKENGLPSTSISAAQAALKKAATKVKEVGTKFIKAGAIYAVGESLTTVATEVARVAGGDKAADITKKLGDILSAGVALGSQFGALGAAAGIAISGLKAFYDGLKEIQQSSEDYAKKMRDIMYTSSAEDLMYRLISSFKEAGYYEIGNEIDADAQAKMYDNIMNNLKYGKGKSMDQIAQEAQDTYFNTRAANIARRDLTERTTDVDLGVTKTTPLSDADRKNLMMAFYRLRDQGLITTGTQEWVRKTIGNKEADSWGYTFANGNEDYVPTDEDFLSHLSTTELISYLKANGLQLSSQEALTKFLEIAEGTLKEFLENKEYNADLIFKIASGDNTYNSWEEMLTAAGFIRDGQYGWVLKAQLELVQPADTEAKKTTSERIKDAYGSARWYEYPGLFISDLFAKSPLGKWLGMSSNGGLLRPIYRASGGDVRGVDTLPAMLQPGEYVMRKSAVSKIGTGVLNALNMGDLGKASQLLGAKVSNSWNNARSYVNNANRVYKTVNNRVFVNNRTNSGRVSSYANLANRLAAGI